MKCIGPQPLDDGQLSDAVNGVFDDAVKAHLERCESCRKRYIQAKLIDDALRHQLYRWDCPPPETLVDFQMGALDPFSARSIQTHVRGCTRCKQELAALQEFMDDEVSAAVSFAGGYTRQERALRAAPVYHEAELVRGLSSEPVVHQASDGTQIVLDVRERQGRPTLYGQIIDGQAEAWQGALVEIRQGDGLTSAATVDDLDSFFAPLPSDEPIQMRITRADGKVIILRDLAVRTDDQDAQ